MSEMKGTVYKQKRSHEETLYFGGFFLFMLFHLFKNVNYSFNEIFLDSFKYLSILFSLLYFFLSLWRYSVRWRLFIFLIILLSIIVGSNSEGFRNQLLMTPLLVFGAKGIEFKKILKFSFLVNAIFCISVITLYLLGFLDNYVPDSSRESILGSVTRNTFGYIWPTNLATHVFFILLMLWILKNGKLNIFYIVFYCAVFFWILIYTDSRLGAGCILILVLFSILLKLKIVNLITASSKFSLFFVCWVPFAAFIIYFATIKYDATDPVWVASDLLLSGRLHISQETIIQNGIPLFGQKLKMYGGDMNGDLYNYVDSAYLQMFVLWGVIYTVLFLFAYLCIGIKYHRLNNAIMLLALFVAGVTGVFAQHFMEVYMNPILLALMASPLCSKTREKVALHV